MAAPLPLRLRVASMMVRGSMRSWTCSDTVGTSKDVCSALPAHWSCRVQVGVVGVSLPSRVPVGLRRDETHGRVVQPILVPVVVGLDRPLGLVWSSSRWHGALLVAILPPTAGVLEYQT